MKTFENIGDDDDALNDNRSNKKWMPVNLLLSSNVSLLHSSDESNS